jgi:hypothetical protein
MENVDEGTAHTDRRRYDPAHGSRDGREIRASLTPPPKGARGCFIILQDPPVMSARVTIHVAPR